MEESLDYVTDVEKADGISQPLEILMSWACRRKSIPVFATFSSP